MAYYYWPPPSDNLHEQMQQLTQQVDELKQEQAMPALVLNRYRNSICYIFGVYQVGFPQQRPALRARISGTGFVVADGLLATNRHVAEPWYGDPESTVLIGKGATPRLENCWLSSLASLLRLISVRLRSLGMAIWPCFISRIQWLCINFGLCRWLRIVRSPVSWLLWLAIRWESWAWSRSHPPPCTTGWLFGAMIKAPPMNLQRFL